VGFGRLLNMSQQSRFIVEEARCSYLRYLQEGSREVLLQLNRSAIKKLKHFGTLFVVILQSGKKANIYCAESGAERNLLQAINSLVHGDLPALSSLGAERFSSSEQTNRREDWRSTTVSAAFLCTCVGQLFAEVWRTASFNRSWSRPGPQLSLPLGA
jgi:hypothetical protein